MTALEPTSNEAIRIGVVTPHAAAGPEEELPAMVPGRVVTCVARVTARAAPGGGDADLTTMAGLGTVAAWGELEESADLLGLAAVDVIGYASTSTAYVIGPDAEAALVARVSRRVGVPVAATCSSCVQALLVLGIARVALVHPPWFDVALNELGAFYFETQGFDVVSSASAALSRDPRRIEPAAVHEWTSRHLADDAEAVFIGGNGFRAAAAISALEDAICRPVLTSNQVLLWNLLRRAGAAFEVTGYGCLFAHENGPPSRGVARPSESSESSGAA
jgi:maleate isomerase